MDDLIDSYLKVLSDDVNNLPISTDPRLGKERRSRSARQFPIELSSGETIEYDRRSQADRRIRRLEVNTTEPSLDDLDALETHLGIR